MRRFKWESSIDRYLDGDGRGTGLHDVVLAREADQLAAENARLREALERIAKDSPTEEPSREFTGNSDDDYHAGSDHLHWWYGRIAREALSPAPAKKENERE